MKLALTIHDNTYTVDAQHDAVTVDEMAIIFRGLLVQAGFHPEAVDEIGSDQDKWFSSIREKKPKIK